MVQPDAGGQSGGKRPILPPPAKEQDQQQDPQARLEAEEAARRREEAAAAKRAAREAKQAERQQAREDKARQKAERERAGDVPAGQATRGRGAPPAPARRVRKAQLRLVQVDAWSVMKTSFLLSIAIGIVLIVAVAIIWAVLGAAGVWDSVNSIVQQAVGSADGPQFDVTDYLGTSRVLGFTALVAALDVVLITAIATLGAFLYNLSAALLGGVEVTLAEDN